MTPRTKYSTLLLGVLLVGIIVASVALPMASAQERKNYFAAAWPYLVPPQGHFNTFVTNAITLGIYWDLMEMPLGMYIWHNSSWIKLLATDWKFDKSTMTFTVHLRKGVVWNDGTPFTSKDVKCTWLILYMMGHALFNYVDPKRIETPDDYTVVFHITSPVSPIILERYIIRTNVRAYKTYGKWCDQVEALLKQGKDRKTEEMQKLLASFKFKQSVIEDFFPGLEKVNARITEIWVARVPILVTGTTPRAISIRTRRAKWSPCVRETSMSSTTTALCWPRSTCPGSTVRAMRVGRRPWRTSMQTVDRKSAWQAQITTLSSTWTAVTTCRIVPPSPRARRTVRTRGFAGRCPTRTARPV